MPQMDGFEVAAAIHQDSSLTGTAVMMLTSDNRAGDVARAKELGMAGYMVKPIKRPELKRAIIKALAIPEGAQPPTDIKAEKKEPKETRPCGFF